MGELRFPKHYRLLKRPQFLEVRENGSHIHTRHFIVQWMPGQEEHSRIGITVTKRVANAVGRNRVKRMVREAYRLFPELPAVLDMVVIAKRGAPLLTRSQVSTELERAWRKIAAA